MATVHETLDLTDDPHQECRVGFPTPAIDFQLEIVVVDRVVLKTKIIFLIESNNISFIYSFEKNCI